ncbi:cyclic-di-GMP-binding protein [Methylomarinovum caldicuralii]|uniref:Cyclic-di-GMP-binding protein n=1 Tax=Methylomarinovum caldicuralii TaxID=438856 RepID=A0AAU9C7N2_9GAMM|nr:cyclic-di-GMP-binding protein [Methylomarinovum caldicuralii]
MPIPAESSLLEPQALRSWLQDLPWVDTPRVARCLREQLCQLAERPLVPRQRALLLQCYQPHLLMLTATLEESLFDASLPLPPTEAEKAQLLVDLCELMARNYGLLADIWASAPTSADAVLPILHHALDWLARLGLHRAQIYAPPGAAFWKTVYHLFQLIERHELLLHPAAEPVREPLHVLFLFAVCNPPRFRPRELRQIDRLLRRFGRSLIIHPDPRHRDRSAGFAFDYLDPTPPRPRKRLPELKRPRADRRFLFTQPVIRQLLDYVKTEEPSGVETLPFCQSRRLALRLAHSLGAPKQRRWLRRRQSRNCRAIVGLEELVVFLRKHQDTDLEALMRTAATLENPEPGFSLETPAGAGEKDEARYSEVDALHILDTNKAQIRPEDIWGNPVATSPETVMEFSAQLADVSARGYRLHWHGSACPRLRPGEILSLVWEDGEPEIATIRWLHAQGERLISLGVELLSFSAQLVVASRFVPDIAEDGPEPQYSWAVLTPAQPAIGRDTCLLVPARTWCHGQWVDIYYTRHRKATFNLRQRLDSSPAYDLFTLEGIKLDAAADTRQ